MYIILVKCNDHFHYRVCDFTAKGQHKSKQEVYVYLYSEFFPLTNVLENRSFRITGGMFTPFNIKVTVGCIQIKTVGCIQIKTDQKCLYVICMRGSIGCVCEFRPWKIQIHINQS